MINCFPNNLCYYLYDDFGINKKIEKKIIEPKIEEYKLNENHKRNINLAIENQLNTNINNISIKINPNSNIEDYQIEDTNNEGNKINIIKIDREENKNGNENITILT